MKSDMIIKNYVISLKCQTERREHIINQFNEHLISFKFFDAIDRERSVSILNSMGLTLENEAITQSELGCFMSHVSLWQMMIDNDLPYLIIFEDDIIFGKSISNVVRSAEKLLLNADYVRLETMKEKVLLGSIANSECYPISYYLESPHMGMAAYIISNRSGKYLIKKLRNTVINKPIDNFLFEDCMEELKVCQLSPAVAIQENILNFKNPKLKSSLDFERSQRRRSNGNNSINSKFIRELKRLGSQISPSNIKQKWQNHFKYKNYIVLPFEDE